ncbi:MAG: Potassium voltage-gated channel subfamily KQT; possible potassium channel, VIC family, partial [uncultured Actinomycetospora sp.]
DRRRARTARDLRAAGPQPGGPGALDRTGRGADARLRAAVPRPARRAGPHARPVARRHRRPARRGGPRLGGLRRRLRRAPPARPGPPPPRPLPPGRPARPGRALPAPAAAAHAGRRPRHLRPARRRRHPQRPGVHRRARRPAGAELRRAHGRGRARGRVGHHHDLRRGAVVGDGDHHDRRVRRPLPGDPRGAGDRRGPHGGRHRPARAHHRRRRDLVRQALRGAGGAGRRRRRPDDHHAGPHRGAAGAARAGPPRAVPALRGGRARL